MTIELIQAIVRQTTVLVAQLATSNGWRAPLAHLADQVFQNLVTELEPLFMGQHFASDNTHSDNAGGVIIGNAWWKAMQQNCIAQ